MSYLSLLEQFLQQESRSSLEKKKDIRTLHLACRGFFRRNQSLLFTNELWNRPLPDHHPGPAECWHRAVGWPLGGMVGAALCWAQMAPVSSNQPTAGQAEPPAMHKAPLGNRSKGRAENARWRKEEGKPRSEEDVLHSKADIPGSPWQTPAWSRWTLLTGIQPLKPTLEQK